ncbi:MAG: hypothetical protein JWR52_1012 [Marmoricola sp.]|nr:hypothetical protein [Marmoricola sp.]
MPVTRPFTARVLIGVLVGIAVTGSLGSPQAAQALGSVSVVDAFSPYEPQVTCTTRPQPGTIALAAWLQRTYPVTGSLGMMRGCHDGGTSEHKDGRAFDWAADARHPATRRAAYAFITRALATDAAGNPDALARRLGIMYMIYNDTIWSSYRGFVPRRYLNAACRTIRRCSPTLRHRNHVHISLGYAGAAGQTSWYRARGVTSLPVLYPLTNELNPDETAVTGLRLSPSGTGTRSSYLLKAGLTYRIVVTGTVTGPTGQLGDANCVRADDGTWAPTSRGALVDPNPITSGWGRSFGTWDGQSQGSAHDQSPYALPLPDSQGVLVDGALRWDATTCSPDHTYESWFRPTIDRRLVLTYADPVPLGTVGTFTAYVARDDITLASLAR